MLFHQLNRKNMKRYIAEFLGSFALVFFGTGAIIVDHVYKGVLTHTGIAISFGLVIMVMIYALADISGAHFNPAVSIALSIAKKFPLHQVVPYILTQLTGCIAASCVLKYLFPADTMLGVTLPTGSECQSFIMELILSFFLMLVIIHVATGSKEQGMLGGLAIGATVMLEALVGGPVTGASMNPARSLGPALVSRHFEHLWLYMVAPVAGASLAIPVWQWLKFFRAAAYKA